MWTIERQHEYLDQPETPELQERMYNDLLALEGLSQELPDTIGARVIVEKGYAIDAACNGRLTRLHYDTDIIIATPDTDSPDELYALVREILGRSTGFSWRATQQKRSSWVKFHEAGKREWDDGITGTDRDRELAHQMDVHVVRANDPFAYDDHIDLVPHPGDMYRKPIMAVALSHVFDQSFELTTPTISDMAATKLRLIKSFEAFYGNMLRSSDYYDFEQLFTSSDFDYSDFYDLISDYYSNKQVMPADIPAIVLKELEPLTTVTPQSLLGFLACKLQTA